MKIQYLGTAAAEGIPAMFCECELCKRAQQAGADEIRTRSGVLINERILMDLSPDLYYHKLRYGLNLTAINTVVVTHSHTDHFDRAELTRRSTEHYCHVKQEQPLVVYGNERVCRLGREAILEEFGKTVESSIRFRTVQPFEAWEVDGVRFQAIPASHDSSEPCLIYVIRDAAGCVLYGNDTGLLSEEAYDSLTGLKFDLVSLDCTFGFRSVPEGGHMGFPENQIFVEALRKRGCIKPETRILATHFSHNMGMLKREVEREGQKYGIEAAYDGMICLVGE